MAKYGIPYQGSKAQIADKIIDVLPSGKRFVDLFGGGGAMSHCAKLSGKYESVLYNEINPLLCDLLKRAMDGEFSYDKFTPEFITREEFLKNKDKDGYIKYIWSFGNNGYSYLFGKDKEEFKRQAHNFLIHNDKDSLEYLENHYKDSYYWHIKNIYDKDFKLGREKYVKIILKLEAIRVTTLYSNSVYDEYKNLSFDEFLNLKNIDLTRKINELLPDIPKKNYKNKKEGLNELKQLQQLERLEQLQQLERLEQLQQLQQLQQLEQLERLEQLQRLKQLERLEQLQQLEQLQRLEQLQQLQQLQRLQRLEISNNTYLNYKYEQGDVVYCNPPYENATEYNKYSFNHKEFYNWVASCNFPVYFSSYDISDDRFEVIYEKQKRNLYSQKNTDGKIEKVYWNGVE